MLEAALWGLAAASALFIGAALGLLVEAPRRLVALMMAFGAGALVSVVSVELSEEAFRRGGTAPFALGLAVGALVYFAGSRLLHRLGGRRARRRSGGTTAPTNGPAILLGVVLDGIPESLALGATLLEGQIGLAFLAAVFVSNLPEAFAGTRDLLDEGRPPRLILALWAIVAVASALAAGLGFAVLGGMSDLPVAFVQAFAAGAILTMLADTMMPEAYEHGGDVVGLATALGFAVAFLVSAVNG